MIRLVKSGDNGTCATSASTPARPLSGFSPSALLEMMASHSAAEVDATLERLISTGKVSISNARLIRLRARQRRQVNEAREWVLRSADEMVLHAINSVGRTRTPQSELQGDQVHATFVLAVDALIGVCTSEKSGTDRPARSWSPMALESLLSGLQDHIDRRGQKPGP